MKRIVIGVWIVFIALSSCRQDTLFNKVSSSHSGINFSNDIPENDSINIIDLENVYNGGGVGIADFNNDGLQDIYFTGNRVSNKLYLNKGNFQFEDITAIASVDGDGKWSRGVAVVDINNDGWQDIYVSATILKDSVKRENIFYINQGLNKQGIPVFKDLAGEYGLNDNSHTTQAAFFDYDNDGDLDVYLAINEIIKIDHPNRYRKILKKGEHPNTDKLFRNDWDSIQQHPVFTNVSKEEGITIEGYAHSVTVCDLNLDGWKDVYVANDYLSNNILYINNGNGTFTDRAKDYFKHTAANAMGADVVDINNDGLSDVIELDMNPEDNYRKKTMLGSGNYQNYINNDFYAYQHQYVRNCLQLNMGQYPGNNDSLSHPIFAEIGFYSGIAETDWSWTPLVADFDNDGYRDIIVTNGFPKDITDHDFVAYRNSAFAMNSKEKLLEKIPVVKISNYTFHNNGNLKFSNATKEWGIDEPGFSNGAATADFDNDGDLDVVISNVNDKATIYENTLNDKNESSQHYLRIKLQGDAPNRDAFGTWVKIYTDGGREQTYETNPVRGYLSSIQNIVFFGLGNEITIDSVIVIWPNHQRQKLTDVKADQQLLIKQSDAREMHVWTQSHNNGSSLFREISDSLQLNYWHQQKDFNDFSIQRLLPHKFSQYAPPMAAGDINNDGLEDLIIGNGPGNMGAIFVQRSDGKFLKKNFFEEKQLDISVYDRGLQLFDADKDGDLDLYVSVGGYEAKAGSASYQDKFFINDGKGNFQTDSTALPLNHSSKSCVRAADYDRDGDLDLFLGGRVEPHNYPKPVSSYIYRNDSQNGQLRFTDVTKTIAPSLQTAGLICDATWTDYDEDGWPDLVWAGEWMPLVFLKNQNGKFTDETATTGIADKLGWWNCLAAGDFDKDGDTDYVAGNLGENSFLTKGEKLPVHDYYNDFDKNGVFEGITTKYFNDKEGNMREFTTHSRDEVADQLPFIKKKTLTYKGFAETPFGQLFSKKEQEGMLKLTANFFSSSFIRNLGNGKFEITPLPAMAQLAPVFAMVPGDFDGDGNLDLIMCGNDFGTEVFNGRLDALNGLMLRGNGKGRFDAMRIQESGIYIPGNAHSLIELKTKNGQSVIIAAQHNGSLRAFGLNAVN
ncbi:VCBS repeat-containing protein [Terrimonas pollutisoli]|uniref:VCBS repeat-containing protein n=1 Tax=Terrimonas pollutisoli TaxID=3034147 RepID=UPI0023EB2BA3|nr:VCBS repeat-containing protein [Terrimonas sp. H1YJ31]